MQYAIETQHLSRRYGRTEAVRDLTMTVPTGSVYALVGPNGAGKTTTIKTLMNLLRPSSGRATVLGTDSESLGPATLQRIGYVSENQELPQWMTVKDLIGYCAPLYPTWDHHFATRLTRQLDLPLDKPMRACSRGMKMKAALAVSLAYRPELLIMDEPFAGLDALVREEFARGLLEASGGERPWTVFVSSHDIDEVERLADWVGIINQGRMELAEPVSALLERFRQIEVIVEDTAAAPSAPRSSWMHVEATGHVIRFVESDFSEHEIGPRVRAVIPDAGDIAATTMSLRQIFIALARIYRLSE